MWIVPKTLSAFVRDTEGLNLGLDERAWMCAQSLMWRSKPSAAPTWQRRLKKDSWMTHLSTRILKPSQQKSFEEKYTASLEDIPVSRSVARESEKERKTQDTCGHTSEAMSGQLDLFGASLKMSEATPRWGYGESCPIWKKMVTERSSDCTQRRKQARLTNASDASSWPTARTSDSQGHSESKIKRVREGTMPAGKAQLREWVNPNWPTPRAGNPGSRKPGTGGKILAEEAKKNWYTPDCSDRRSAKSKQQGLSNQAKIHAGPPAQEKSSTSGNSQGSPKLNPNWVEQLMGLPIGWTDLGSWGTELSPKPQN